MADKIVNIVDDKGAVYPQKLKDMGDGTYALQIATTSIGGGAGDASAANQLTEIARLEAIRDRLPATPDSRGAGNVDATTQRVVLAADGPTVTAIGGQDNAAATADGTGNYSIIAALKRGLINWATLLTRIPAPLTPGLLPVDSLGTPGVSRVLATSGAAASVALTATCRRVSMYATEGTWYSISGAASTTSHYISKGERLDFNVPAGTTISVLQETTAGSIRITELA